MKRTTAPFILLLVIFCTASAHSEVYRWVDDEGKVRFSDKPPTASQGKPATVNFTHSAAEDDGSPILVTFANDEVTIPIPISTEKQEQEQEPDEGNDTPPPTPTPSHTPIKEKEEDNKTPVMISNKYKSPFAVDQPDLAQASNQTPSQTETPQSMEPVTENPGTLELPLQPVRSLEEDWDEETLARERRESQELAKRLLKKQDKCTRSRNALENARVQIIERQQAGAPEKSIIHFQKLIDRRQADMERNCS